MSFPLFVVIVLAIVCVAGASILLDTDVSTDSDAAPNGKVNGMVERSIVIGIILFICALLSLYLYRKCVCPATCPLADPSATIAQPLPSPLTLTSHSAGRASPYIAYPPPTFAATPAGRIPLGVLPHGRGSARGTKTKVIVPVTGPRISSVRKNAI